MNKKYIFAISILLALAFLFVTLFVLANNIAVLNPKGIIALKERNLIIFALLLSLLVVVPVFVLTFVFAWKFREGKQEKYDPDWDHNPLLEAIWWALPGVIILVLAAVTWISTHQLDPSKPLPSSTQPIEIQVVALQWKWLFIYPEQNIATVNFVQFPQRTPINFELTADAPMNSFWIPQLSGQIYAMPGMRTQLHLEASAPGEFAGSAAEISGRGFAGMKFIAKASSVADFDAWMQRVLGFGNTLDVAEYNRLAAPSENNPAAFYASIEENLFNEIIMKFTVPSGGNTHMQQGMEH